MSILLPAPLAARAATPLWDNAAGTAFALADADADEDSAVITAVTHPVLLHFPAPRSQGRAMLVIGGGGYTQLMAGREGVMVAKWLNRLGFDAHVLVHRFPDADNGVQAPLDDAARAMRLIRKTSPSFLGVVGLSSGGHLAACLIAAYPADWRSPDPLAPDPLAPSVSARPDCAVIGYAPISTNAAGRTVIANKPPLAPPEKQAFYDALQPDVQLVAAPPPTFIAYAANDPVVPVSNAWRLADALCQAGANIEVHVFADAPHGFALDTADQPVSLWPELCEAWMRQTGFLTTATSA